MSRNDALTFAEAKRRAAEEGLEGYDEWYARMCNRYDLLPYRISREPQRVWAECITALLEGRGGL